MNDSQISFEQILSAMLHMLRETWKAKACLFLQMGDQGLLRIRAVDGIKMSDASDITLGASDGAFGKCCASNKIVEVQKPEELGSLVNLIKPLLNKDEKFIMVPVFGESKVIGLLLMGPFPKSTEVMKRDAELRSAGALCAVLSAHWRLYEWMDSIVPQLNHSLRTPLTAVQGSIGMVLGGVFGQVGNDVKEMLEMAQKGCERTVRAIEDYINNQLPTHKK